MTVHLVKIQFVNDSITPPISADNLNTIQDAIIAIDAAWQNAIALLPAAPTLASLGGVTAVTAAANALAASKSADTITDSATKVLMLAAERAKLAGIAAGATANSTDAALLAAADAAAATRITALINGAPGILDTLGEIAAQLGSDESAVAALTTLVSGKAAQADLLTEIARAQAAEARAVRFANRAVVTATTDTALANTLNRYDATANAIAITAPAPAAAGADGDWHMQFSVSRRDTALANAVTLAYPNSAGVTITITIGTSDTTKVLAQVTALGYQVISDSIPLAQITPAAIGAVAAPLVSTANVEALRAAPAFPYLYSSVAMANRDQKRFNGLLITDSYGAGQGQVNFDDKYGQELTRLLRAQWPTKGLTDRQGGRGYIPIRTTGETTIVQPWTLTGTGNQGGYGANQFSATFSNTTGRASINLLCTSVDLLYTRTATGTGVLFYSWDGGATTAGTITLSGASILSGQKFRITCPTPGVASTLTIGLQSGTLGIVGGCVEYNGDELAGIQMHTAGWFGSTAGTWTTFNGAPDATKWPRDMLALDPDIILCAFGTNDKAALVTQAQFTANLRALQAAVALDRGGVGLISASVPWVFVQMSQDLGTAAGVLPMSTYVAGAQDAAALDNAQAGHSAQVIDLSQHMTPAPGSTGTSVDSLGVYYTDKLHLSVKGAKLLAGILRNTLRLAA